MTALPDTVPVRWSKDAEKREWMLENAGGRPIKEVCDAFEKRFGHPLKKTQVTLFRAEYGLSRRRGNRTAHRRCEVPVGTERTTKGYVIVKVADVPGTAQSKDNWRFKHVVAWEKANGMAVPEGCIVMFADRNTRNFDPDNLVAVPRRLIGVLNGGPEWHDRESLEAAVALAELKSGISSRYSAPRKCGVCGKRFVPDIKAGIESKRRQVTCRECLDRGLRSPKSYGIKVCPTCGKPFESKSASAKYCSVACRDAAYREKRKAMRNG